MFGALMESEASLVVDPGSVDNIPPPQAVNHHHNPANLSSSQQHPGNAIALHAAIVEDLPPEELFNP